MALEILPPLGLSPPTRGNPSNWDEAAHSGRSIPAHAGEPIGWRETYCIYEVYPRPRGGTRRDRGQESVAAGLSPPTRGNRVGSATINLLGRSIPAHAGEPYRPLPHAR